MLLFSWNVNGIKACNDPSRIDREDSALFIPPFIEVMSKIDADMICIQESKLDMQKHGTLELEGYFGYFNSAEKKGYSGTATFSKIKPLNVYKNFEFEKFKLPDHLVHLAQKVVIDPAILSSEDLDIYLALHCEGRVLTLEFEKFYLVNVYSPNAKDSLSRIESREKFEDALREYVLLLASMKGVAICGDLNVAHNEIDLKNPASNHKNAGFSDQERDKFRALLNAGFVDSFRHFYPNTSEAYTWWGYRYTGGSRAAKAEFEALKQSGELPPSANLTARYANVGWRIDYFLVSENLVPLLEKAQIYKEIKGSDHCPVGIVLAL